MVFWSARLLCRVGSDDPLCQHCHFTFFLWKQEMIDGFDDFIVDGRGKNGYDVEMNDPGVST